VLAELNCPPVHSVAVCQWKCLQIPWALENHWPVSYPVTCKCLRDCRDSIYGVCFFLATVCKLSFADFPYCLQNKTGTGTDDNATSSGKQLSSCDGVTPAAGPVMGARLRPSETPLQARQPTVDEFRPPNPDELVLGFRRHRMNQHAVLPSLHDRPLTVRQVMLISHKCLTTSLLLSFLVRV